MSTHNHPILSKCTCAECKPVKKTKYHRTPQGHTYGTRKKPFVISYVPALKDHDVIQFLLAERAEGQNITQMITDAIRLLMVAVQSDT